MAPEINTIYLHTINLEYNYCVLFNADIMTKKQKKELYNVGTNPSVSGFLNNARPDV